MVSVYEDDDNPSGKTLVADLSLHDALGMVSRHNRREYDRAATMLASTVEQFPLLPRWIEVSKCIF